MAAKNLSLLVLWKDILERRLLCKSNLILRFREIICPWPNNGYKHI